MPKIWQVPKIRRWSVPNNARLFERSVIGAFVAPPGGMMTLKIEMIPGKDRTVIKLIGRLRVEGIPELKATIERSGGGAILEMNEVTLVDLESVRFLSIAEIQGVELRHCPAYIREWIVRERQQV